MNKFSRYILSNSSLSLRFKDLDTGYFSIFSKIEALVSPFFINSLTTPVNIASNPNSVKPCAKSPHTPNVAIPPIIPPGPNAAKATVIAAAPLKPEAAIAEPVSDQERLMPQLLKQSCP